MATITFDKAVQLRTARVAIGVSATRRQGPGVVEAGREFMGALDLAQFAVQDARKFRSRLDSTTLELCAALPPTGNS